MSEQLVEDQWNDEVCEFWLMRVREEAEKFSIYGSEADMYFGYRMPDPVREYLARKLTQQLAEGFGAAVSKLPGVMPETVEVKVDVSPID